MIPPTIVVWACPRCGYWRSEKSTGVHMIYEGTGPGVEHPLVQASYQLLSTKEEK